MRLKSRSKSEGFYESFSDLIFATMAIFVLLFIITLLLVKSPAEPKEDPLPIDLVVVIDVSASMGQPLEELVETLNDLAQNFPKVLSDFRIGIVAYADRFPDGYKIFPLQEITTETKKDLAEVLAELEARDSFVDITLGLKTGVELFGTDLQSQRRRSLVVIGDMGPYETRNGRLVNSNRQTRYPADRQYEQAGNDLISNYVTQSTENLVLTIYTGNNETVWGATSRNYFCQLAKEASTQGRFTANRGKLVWELLETFLRTEDAELTDQVSC